MLAGHDQALLPGHNQQLIRDVHSTHFKAKTRRQEERVHLAHGGWPVHMVLEGGQGKASGLCRWGTFLVYQEKSTVLQAFGCMSSVEASSGFEALWAFASSTRHDFAEVRERSQSSSLLLP